VIHEQTGNAGIYQRLGCDRGYARSWTQKEAAKRCGVTQPRINDLLRGRISRFSLDALVNIASALGRKVRVSLEDAA
jgi:predicted XRE-type DNA-binding protein